MGERVSGASASISSRFAGCSTSALVSIATRSRSPGSARMTRGSHSGYSASHPDNSGEITLIALLASSVWMYWLAYEPMKPSSMTMSAS